MKITILGATGNAGSRIITEALSRGHEVTAVVRKPAATSSLPPGIKVLIGDANNIKDVIAFSTGQDVVISAIRSASGHESEVIQATRTLMDGLSKSGVRLLVVGGASTLIVPDTGGKTVIEDSNYLPVSARHIGKASADQLAVCLAETRVDWVYLSPAAHFSPGERTGKYRQGTDELLIDAKGISKISMEDAAIVLLDEAEQPKHHQVRFTVAY